MKKNLYAVVIIGALFISATAVINSLEIEGDGYILGQLGIGTDSPEGKLDIVSQDMGIVLPRVNNVFNVSDGNGGDAVDGTIVYDTLRKAMMFRVNNCWVGMTVDENGETNIEPSTINTLEETYTYIKPSNTDAEDEFGLFLSLSRDGNTLAVSSRKESSNAIGIDGNEADNSSFESGAVYVYSKTNDVWMQEAYIKASNTDIQDEFGFSVSVSSDGNTLAVGAFKEDSNSSGINGSDSDNSSSESGAVYVFSRTGVTWTQEAYIKSSNSEAFDFFGYHVSISDDGNTLAVGARNEDSNATGVNGDESDNSLSGAGAAYIFIRSGTTWSQEAYLKSSSPDGGDIFSNQLALSGDGQTLCVMAKRESSSATGIGGDDDDDSASNSGAAYVFIRTGTVWSQQEYIKASNSESDDNFGQSVSLSTDGNTLAIGTWNEKSNAQGINGDETDNSAVESGAVYVFNRSGTTWVQQAYIKTSNNEAGDRLGRSLRLSDDGNTLVAGAYYEASGNTGLNSDQDDNSADNSGAAFVFNRFLNEWSQLYYIKASNTDASDLFAISCDIDINGNIAIGAGIEDSNATGIGGDQTDNSATDSGAVYLIK